MKQQIIDDYIVETEKQERENSKGSSIVTIISLGNGENIFLSDNFSASMVVGKNNKKSGMIIPRIHEQVGNYPVSTDVSAFSFASIFFC